jgi:hypothetical protein
MDGKGWKPEYGISAEGVELLGYLEALPQEVRRELADAIGTICRREGATVIPLFRRSQRG